MAATCTGCSSAPEGTAPQGARFAHASEARFARLLDFYRLRWEYEPHTYALAWDETGAATESFTPDFWLPDLRVYVEVTVRRQAYTTRKNRKIRRLRELYPQVDIRSLYRRDLDSLGLKYAGRAARPVGRFHALRA